MKRSVKQSFIASVHDDYMDQIDQIADKLRSKGCEIKDVLQISGVITGKVKMHVKLEELYVEGIVSIEKQRIVKKK